MAQLAYALTSVLVVVCGGSLVTCSSTNVPVESAKSPLETQDLVITEVAQATDFGGAVADKVEVYCTRAAGCSAFRVCDTASGGQACSALQTAMVAGQRVVVSRGANITTSDAVWLADGASVLLPGTRVGPFDCSAGAAQSRIDCSIGVFGACGTPNLGQSSGQCKSGDFTESFQYQVRFTQNQHGLPEASCNRTMCQELVAQIDAALTSIDFAVYGLRGQPQVIDALVRAQARGVAVRGIVDSENADCTQFGYADSRSLIDALPPGAVVCDTGPGYSYIMHNKFFLFDGAKLWTGSTNISDTELGGEYNSDVAVLFSSYRLAEIYTAEFDEMYSGHFHRRKTDNTEHVISEAHFSGDALVRSYFSPTDHAVENAVLPLIEQATQNLDIAMFFFTHQRIADALIAAKARNVQVRMILDAGGASNTYSKHNDLCAAGIEVKLENWGGKSHSKWVVADAALPASAAVVFGSMNFTASGDEQNDENTLYVKHPGLAVAFQAEFDRQWADLSSVPACTRVSVEGADSSQCTPAGACQISCSSGSCCDGLDNDYDGRVDLAEEACACADGRDNDGDGYIDAADFDCQTSPVDP